MRRFSLKIIAYIWLFFRKDAVVFSLSIFFTILSLGVGVLISRDRSRDQDYFAFNDLPLEVAGVAIGPSPSIQPVDQTQSLTVLGPEQPVATTKKLAIVPVVSPSPKPINPSPSPTVDSQGGSHSEESHTDSSSISDADPTATPQPSATASPSQTPEPTSTPSPSVAPSSTPEPTPQSQPSEPPIISELVSALTP